MTQFTRLSVLTGLFTMGAIVLASTSAQAFNFTRGTQLGSCANLLTTPAASCTTKHGFTLTAGSEHSTKDKKVLEVKTVNDNFIGDDGYIGDVKGVGVSRGNKDVVSGEVNLKEYIDLTLAGNGGILGSLDFSFLYPPGEFYDTVYEVVSADTSGLTGKLTVKSTTSALWEVFSGTTQLNSLTQTLTAISNSTDGNSATKTPEARGGGWYSVLNPFGKQSVKRFVSLRPRNQAGKRFMHKTMTMRWWAQPRFLNLQPCWVWARSLD